MSDGPPGCFPPSPDGAAAAPARTAFAAVAPVPHERGAASPARTDPAIHLDIHLDKGPAGLLNLSRLAPIEFCR